MTELEAFQAMLDRWIKEVNTDDWSNAEYSKEVKDGETTIRIDETGWVFDASGKMIGTYNFKQ